MSQHASSAWTLRALGTERQSQTGCLSMYLDLLRCVLLEVYMVLIDYECFS